MHSRTINFCLLCILLLTTCKLQAQSRTIEGCIRDAQTGKPLAGSSVFVLKGRQGAVCDGNGRFRLPLPAGSSRLVISSLGYATDTVQAPEGKTFLDLRMQPSEEALSEVVVTSMATATRARESPVAVAVVAARQLEKTAESNIIDALVKNVPGLNAVKTGPNISKPFIRGLGYNRVLTLYDGIRQEGQQWGHEHGIEADAYNLEKAEVIKGPASLIYGSDALAGVVSLFPAMPAKTDDGLSGKYISEYQSNNGLIGNALRLGFSKHNWGLMARGSHRMAQNYTNRLDGRVYNSGFRETNLSAGIRHWRQKGQHSLNFTYYDNQQGVPDGSRDSLSRKFTRQVYEGSEDDITARPIVAPDDLNSYRLSPLRQHIRHYRLYTHHHFIFEKGSADFLLAWQQNIRQEFNHPTATNIPGMFVRLNTLNYGLNYHLPLFSSLEISAGVNGMYQQNKNRLATSFPIPDYRLFDAGSYLFARWKENKWTVSSGFRYDIRRLKGRDFYIRTNAVTGFDEQAPDTAGAFLQFPAFSTSFKGSSASLGATFRWNSHISVKANAASGYRAPNITEFASNGLDPGAHITYLGNRNFRPETSFQQDLGMELSFPQWTASASLFHNHLRNYIYLNQVTDTAGNPLTDAQGNRTFQYRQSAARLYGLEVAGSFHPRAWKGFSADHSIALIYGTNEQAGLRGKGIQGAYLPLIPPLKMSGGLAQQMEPKWKTLKSLELRAEGEYNAAQNRYLALNGTETATPAYLLVHLSAGMQFPFSKSKALQLLVQVNNLLDKAYQSHLSRLKYFEYYQKSPDGYPGIYNMGRNFCMRMSVPL